MTLTRRQRFYQKIFLDANSIPVVDTWKDKNLTILDRDGLTRISNLLTLPTNLTTFVISLDNENRTLEYSFNGRDLDGEILCDDGPFSQDCTSEGYLYLRLPEGTVLDVDEKVRVRIWAWRGGVGK